MTEPWWAIVGGAVLVEVMFGAADWLIERWTGLRIRRGVIQRERPYDWERR